MTSERSLDDVCELVVDCPHKTAPESAEAYAYAVGTKAVRDGRIDFSQARPVSEETYSSWIARATPREGDIILCREAPVGPAGRIPAAPRVCLGQRTVLLRPDPRQVDPDYLLYALLAPHVQAALQALSEGSTVAHLNVADVRRFTLALPSLAEQSTVARVLRTVDEKIDSNYRLNRTLEQLADAMIEHHVARSDFSTPGWESGDLTTLARFVNGRAFTKDANGRGRPIVRIKELNSGISGNTLYADLPAQDENVVRHHELLFAWSGSLGLHRWHGPESLINQHIFKVIPNSGYPVWFVEAWLRRHVDEFRRIAADKATTMGHIKREHLKLAKVAIPPRDVLEELDVVLDPADRQIGALASETITLLEVREALLCRLLEPAGVVTQLRSASSPWRVTASS